MCFFLDKTEKSYEDKITQRLLTYTDMALEMAEKFKNDSNTRVDISFFVKDTRTFTIHLKIEIEKEN
jgi:hypothetical protein